MFIWKHFFSFRKSNWKMTAIFYFTSQRFYLNVQVTSSEQFSCSCFLHSVTVDYANQIITAMELHSEGIFCLNPEENKDLSFAFSWHLYTSFFLLLCFSPWFQFISLIIRKKILPCSAPLTDTCIFKALSHHVPSHYLWTEEKHAYLESYAT